MHRPGGMTATLGGGGGIGSALKWPRQVPMFHIWQFLSTAHVHRAVAGTDPMPHVMLGTQEPYNDAGPKMMSGWLTRSTMA